MSIQIPMPNITASDDARRLRQIQGYLYRMAGQLQWAFDTLEGTGSVSGAVTAQPQAAPKSDPASAFGQIKNLIIKSADIVESYSQEITRRLEGIYVAQSEFGAFREETALELEADSQGLRQLYTHVQAITDTVEGLYDSALATNAYLKSGLLDSKSDGTAVYGLEIGQTNSIGGETVFDKFARFTADRLSFFDSNDVEVAYISDYKLYITNAEITGSLWLSGRFKICYNGGLAFQWIGGGG